MTIALVVALGIALGVIAIQAIGILSLAKTAIARADARGVAETKAAKVEGALVMANVNTEEANEAARETAVALDKEKDRGDKLEAEVVAAPAGAGWAGVHEADALEDPNR